jgi:hypothetical protein
VFAAVAHTPRKEVLSLRARKKVHNGLYMVASSVVEEVCEEGGADLADWGGGAFWQVEQMEVASGVDFGYKEGGLVRGCKDEDLNRKDE